MELKWRVTHCVTNVDLNTIRWREETIRELSHTYRRYLTKAGDIIVFIGKRADKSRWLMRLKGADDVYLLIPAINYDNKKSKFKSHVKHLNRLRVDCILPDDPIYKIIEKEIQLSEDLCSGAAERRRLAKEILWKRQNEQP